MTDQNFRQGDTAAGPGEPGPLPEGAATQLNQATAQAAAAAQPEAAPEPQAAPPEAPAAAVAEPNFNPITEEDKFLYAPTQFPNESQTTGILQNGNIAPPVDLSHAIPAILQAGADPNAPPGLQLLVNLLADQYNPYG